MLKLERAVRWKSGGRKPRGEGWATKNKVSARTSGRSGERDRTGAFDLQHVAAPRRSAADLETPGHAVQCVLIALLKMYLQNILELQNH